MHDTSRRVRLGDVDPDGNCRLDAMVRYLQDIARDDSADSGLQDPMNWVARRTMVEVRQAPVFQEGVALSTWCSGYGGRWAERSTSIRGDAGGRIDGVSIWVYFDEATGRPMKLRDDFFQLYGETAQAREVSARTTLPSRPPEDATDEPWPLRHVDLDILGHVNNAAHWAPVAEMVDRMGWSGRCIRAELEHGAELQRDGDTRVWSVVEADGTSVSTWLGNAGAKPSSVARVSLLD